MNLDLDFSKISVIGLDVDGTITNNDSTKLLPEAAVWIAETAKQYPHLNWFLGTNQGGVAWRHYCENQDVPYMSHEKVVALPTAEYAYWRLNAIREQLEGIIGKTVWVVCSFAYRFKKPYRMSEDNPHFHTITARRKAYGDNLYWPHLEPSVPTRHFSFDNLPKPSGDIIKVGAAICGARGLEPDMGRVLFIGDADGTPLDFYKNPRTEDMDEANTVGCHFRSPSIWAVDNVDEPF